MINYYGGPGRGTDMPPIDLGGAVVNVYIRTTGSDATGNGTLANPYRTLAFALSKMPLAYDNGCYFFDYTGITETMTRAILAPLGAHPPFSIVPESLEGFVLGGFCLHADLIVSSTILAGAVLSVSANAAGLNTFVTSGGLTINALVGKCVRQAGAILGFVTANTATDISIAGFSGSAGVALELCDPGATLNNLTLVAQSNVVQIEGTTLQSAAAQGLTCKANESLARLLACTVGTYNIDGRVFLSQCHVKPSGGSNQLFLDGYLFCNRVFFDSVVPKHGITTGIYTWGVNYCRFTSCGPVGGLHNTAYLVQNINFSFAEFTAPLSSAVYLRGSGVFRGANFLINNSVAGPLRFDGPIKVELLTAAAGTGNAGIGVQLEDGAHLTANAGVLLAGAGGEVKIGNLAVTTWALVTAAPNNRISDYGVNGDGSSAKRV